MHRKIGILLIFSTLAAADPIYTVAGLGGSTSTGFAVNTSGVVAGTAQDPFGSQQAFVSTPNSVRILSPNASESHGYGINDTGTVVGTTYINGQAYGTIWDGSGTRLLGSGSYAMAINNAGEVVGGNGQAFIDANGQLQPLDTGAGVDWSAAYAVNDAGMVAGDGQLANGTFRGIVWSPDGSMTLLGTLGGPSSQATGVNNSGEVVGFASLANGYQHAFALDGATMMDLGTLGGSSYAYGVNDSGEVVGYSYLADGQQHAFLYDDGVMFDLNALLPKDSGWELLAAYGINASGQITGVGIHDGQMEAFLATDPPPPSQTTSAVPEPRQLWLLLAAAGLFAHMRLRRDGYSRGFPIGMPNSSQNELPIGRF